MQQKENSMTLVFTFVYLYMLFFLREKIKSYHKWMKKIIQTIFFYFVNVGCIISQFSWHVTPGPQLRPWWHVLYFSNTTYISGMFQNVSNSEYWPSFEHFDKKILWSHFTLLFHKLVLRLKQFWLCIVKVIV